MRNHFRRCDVSKMGTRGERETARKTKQESRGILITRSGRIDNLRDRFSRHNNRLTFPNHNRPFFTARNRGDARLRPQLFHRRIKISRLIEAQKFFFIGEENVDLRANKLAEAVSMSINAETIGQRE